MPNNPFSSDARSCGCVLKLGAIPCDLHGGATDIATTLADLIFALHRAEHGDDPWTDCSQYWCQRVQGVLKNVLKKGR